MSTLLSPSHSLVEIDHSSDHSDAPLKPFASPSPSHSNSHVNNGRRESQRSLHQYPPARPSAPEPVSPPSSPPRPASSASTSATNISKDLTEFESSFQQSPSHSQQDAFSDASAQQDSPPKPGLDRDTTAVPQGSDPEEDPDLGSGESDGDWSQEEYEADIRRVKVYELVGQKWTDRGTAFCQGEYDEEARQARLIARAEHNNDVLLQCIIHAADIYQRQQDTLIVWTEPDRGDYALSFQDIDGCSEVWEFIGEVQRHLRDKGEEDGLSSDAGSSMHMFSAESMNSFIHAAKLPNPALRNMHECGRVIKQICRQPHGKERLCDYIILNDYVKQVIDVHRQAEDSEDIHELHACYCCMQAILLINEPALYEYILQDAIFSGVLGVLEYDPEFPTHKALYREFFESSARFREPIPIRDSQIRIKIHQTYRLQLLKDFVLARLTDDATFNVLNSCIIFNQIDIVTSVQQDERFLRELVGLFLTADKGDVKEGKRTDKGKGKSDSFSGAAEDSKLQNENSSFSSEIGPQHSPDWFPSSSSSSISIPPYSLDERRKDTIHLIQQLCLLGKNVQLPARMQLFRTLVDKGVLHAIQWALGRHEPQMLSTAGEVLSLILDHDVGGVRQHVMKQVGIAGKPTMGVSVNVAGHGGITGSETKRETLLETLCKSLTTTQEVAYRSQMADALKAVLDVPQADGHEPTNIIAMRAMARAKDDPVTERFLDHFYQKCSENLFKPFAELPEHHKVKERALPITRDRSSLYLYLCDLLTSFALQHSFRSHFFIISSSNSMPPIIPRVASLLLAREKHLCLASLRFFRATLKFGNPNIFLQLVKHDVFAPILQLTIRESRLDNLLSSCCQEFFEHIRRENFKDLLSHLMSKYQADINELAASPVCGERFHNLIRRWEMNNEPPPIENEKPPSIVPSIRKWGQGNSLEAEEEDYFNKSDEEDTPKMTRPSAIPPSINMLKRKRGRVFSGSSLPSQKQLRPSLPRSPMQNLVDYGDDDEEDITNVASPSKHVISTVVGRSKPTLSNPQSSFKPMDWFAGLQIPSPMAPLPSSTSSTASSKKKDPSDLLDEVGDDITESTLSRLSTRSPPRMAEKRRRADEDDEDEMLERLVKSKKPNNVTTAQKIDPFSKLTGTGKASSSSGKLKLKLGSATSFSLASNSQLSPSPQSPSPTSPSNQNVDSG